MAVKFPPPPYLTTQNPDTQRLNRWLIEIQSILNNDGTVNVGPSPAFTGIPTAPTAPLGTDTAQLATTAFVIENASGASPSTSVPLVDATPGHVGTSPDFARGDHVHPTDNSRAPINSPAFTGTPTAPTAAPGDNSAEIANTAFVQAAVGGGGGGAGLAQAWVDFVGSTGAINESFNVSGVVRNSAGNYTITFASGFATAHYVSVCTVIGTAAIAIRVLSRTTTTLTISTLSTTFAAIDPGTGVSLVVFGT